MTANEPTTLEEQGWQALSSGGEVAAEFYSRILDRAVVMLLPGGMVLDDRDTIIKSMSGPPWASYELSDWRVLRPTPETAVVTYTATARRGDDAPYTALMSSVYVRREDGWKLAFHQQTPR